MNLKEALENYLSYIQDNDFEIPEDACSLLGIGGNTEIATIGETGETGGATLTPSDVTSFDFTDANANKIPLSLLSYVFGLTVKDTLENIPVLLRKTTTKAAKFPTSGTDLYAGPVTNLNTLTTYPITDAVNNRGFWIDLQGNPGSSQIVSSVIYIDSDRKPHVCVTGLNSSYKPVENWVDLTQGSSHPSIDYQTIVDDSADFAMSSNAYTAVLSYLNSGKLDAVTGVTVTDSSTAFDETAYIHTTFRFDLGDMSSSSNLYKAMQVLKNYRQGDVKGFYPFYPLCQLSANTTPEYRTTSAFMNMTVSTSTIEIEIEATLTAQSATDATALATAAQSKLMYYYLNAIPFLRQS